MSYTALLGDPGRAVVFFAGANLGLVEKAVRCFSSELAALVF